MSIITGSGSIIVDFKVKAVHGSPALGSYLLKFSIEYSMPPQTEGKTLFHKSNAKIYVGKEKVFLGVAIPEQVKTFMSASHPQKGGLLYEILISRDAIDEIEKLRVGGDIEFKIDISGECIDSGNQLSATEILYYTANQKEWVEVLSEMKYRGGIVFELPMDIEPGEEVRTALEAIEKAKKHLYYGNYDDVVAKCRISLESIVKKWGKIGELKNTANKKSMSKELRLFNAIDGIIHFTHLAHHPSDEGEYITYNRSEAVFVLGSTISAISSYTENKI